MDTLHSSYGATERELVVRLSSCTFNEAAFVERAQTLAGIPLMEAKKLLRRLRLDEVVACGVPTEWEARAECLPLFTVVGRFDDTAPRTRRVD